MTARISGFVLHCADPARIAEFYHAAFGATPAKSGFRIGEARVWVAQGRGAARLGPVFATSFQHFAIVVRDMAAAYAHLLTVPGWSAISRGGPLVLPKSSGGVTAYKFRDPDGHPLELLAFPEASVPAVWQNRAGLFLGIDHTAVAVSDTARAEAFYKRMGFYRTGGSSNEGEAQGALDGLDDPLVEVTALALGAAPPHLELLCYRRPSAVADAREREDALATEICFADGDGQVLSDPDGHWLRL